MKKVLLILFIILFCIFCKINNTKDFKNIDKITNDCINNSSYSYNVCYNYAFTLTKTGKEILNHYSYTFTK
jgi:hypothetical protein